MSSEESKLINSYSSILSQLSFGSLAGYSAGVACKYASKIALVAIGSCYCAIQTAAYYGYIQVNWRRIERDTKSILDFDQDGEITKKDLNALFRKTIDVLAFNLPASAGFTGAFLFGMTGYSRSSLALTASGLGLHLVPRLAIGTLALPGLPVAVGWFNESLGLVKDPTEEHIRKTVNNADAESRKAVREELENRLNTAVIDERKKRLTELIAIIDDYHVKEIKRSDGWFQNLQFWKKSSVL